MQVLLTLTLNWSKNINRLFSRKPSKLYPLQKRFKHQAKSSWSKCLILSIAITFFACNHSKQQFQTTFGPGLLIVNQGNYTYSNASISFYDFNSKQTIHKAFFLINHFHIGDVAQSATIIDTNIFIVVNNSGKILVLNKNTFKYTATITGLTSPRYMQVVNDSLAYVTDLYGDLSIINYRFFRKTGQIRLGRSSEAIARWHEYVFVTNWSYGNKIFRINTSTQAIDSLTVRYQPNSLAIDKNGKVWVLSDGGLIFNTDKDTVPALTVIDAQRFEIERIYGFDSTNISPTSLVINQSKDTLFFLVSAWQPTQNANFGVYRMAVSDSSLPVSPFISQGQHTFYALNYLSNGWLAVCDAKDFVQPGQVLIFDSRNGELLFSAPAGIIPGYVVLKN